MAHTSFSLHPHFTLLQLNMSQNSSDIKWVHLPDDIRVHILSFLPLFHAYNLNLAHPHPAHSQAIRARIAALATLRHAWIHSCHNPLPSYSNPPHLATSAARAKLLPIHFTHLTTLTLRSTDLTSLGPIHEFSRLRVIDASHNALATLPSTIAMCPSLRVLNLGFNNFRHFPTDVMHLPHLCTLLFHNNPLTSLPSNQWLALPNLYRLGLFGCHLTGSLPEELCKLLVTPTARGRYRSANFKQNNLDRIAVARLFQQFPRLSSVLYI